MLLLFLLSLTSIGKCVGHLNLEKTKQTKICVGICFPFSFHSFKLFAQNIYNRSQISSSSIPQVLLKHLSMWYSSSKKLLKYWSQQTNLPAFPITYIYCFQSHKVKLIMSSRSLNPLIKIFILKNICSNFSKSTNHQLQTCSSRNHTKLSENIPPTIWHCITKFTFSRFSSLHPPVI